MWKVFQFQKSCGRYFSFRRDVGGILETEDLWKVLKLALWVQAIRSVKDIIAIAYLRNVL